MSKKCFTLHITSLLRALSIHCHYFMDMYISLQSNNDVSLGMRAWYICLQLVVYGFAEWIHVQRIIHTQMPGGMSIPRVHMCALTLYDAERKSYEF